MKLLSIKTFLISVLLVPLLITSSDVLAENIYACARENDGRLRIVSAPGQCKKQEYEVFWSKGDELSNDINEIKGRLSALETLLDRINAPPAVQAGDDVSILLSTTHLLEGTASDDGIYDPLTFAWEAVSGPGNVYFSDPSSLLTSVSFDAEGSYELSITAFDGEISVSDSLTIIVFPDNDPPTVQADEIPPFYGSMEDNNIITCSTGLSGSGNDDGSPSLLTYEWDVRYTGNFDGCDGGCLHLLSFPTVEQPSDLQATASHTQDLTYHDGLPEEPSLCMNTGTAIQCGIPIRFTLHASDGFHTVSSSIETWCIASFPISP